MRKSAPIKHSIPSFLLLFVLLLVSPLALAAKLNPLLESLHKFRVQNFLALNAYYNYSVNGDKATFDDIRSAVNKSNEMMKQIHGRAGKLISDEHLKQLDADFETFKKLMRINIEDVRKKGYPDLQEIAQMANNADALSKLSSDLYSDVKKQDDVVTDKNVEIARKASLILAKMMTQYTARSSSSVSQDFQGSSQGAPINKQAEQFDSLIQQLNGAMNTKAMQDQYDDIMTKWQFIKSSYIHYNQNNVVFVINRYSLAMINELEDIVDELAGIKPAGASAEPQHKIKVAIPPQLKKMIQQNSQ